MATAPVAVVATVPVMVSLSPAEWDAVHLGRAVDLWISGDLRGAAELLETIDITTTSSFDRADRAAFLLTVAALQLDDVEAFHHVAGRAGGRTGSAYRRWIRYCQLLEAGRGGYTEGGAANLPAKLPGAEILGASLLLEMGRPDDALVMLETTSSARSLEPVHLYLLAMAREAAGFDAMSDWQRLAERTPATTLEADLVATAILRVAGAKRARADGDAISWLRRTPAQSRHAPRALHAAALLALAAGDTTTARDNLLQVLRDHPAYEERREARLALGDMALHNRDFLAALKQFESAGDDWRNEFESLSRLDDSAAVTRAWAQWEQQQSWRDEIRLAPEFVLQQLTRIAERALDLRRDPSPSPSGDLAAGLWPAAEPSPGDAVFARFQPDSVQWQNLRELQQARRHTESVLSRQERVLEDHERDVLRRFNYLQRGAVRADSSVASLEDAATRLDQFIARLDATMAALAAARDHALARVATRTQDMIEELRREQLFVAAVRHFHVDGPQRDRPEAFPARVPSPAALLAREDSLAAENAHFLAVFAARYPDLIARSFAEVWEPRLSGDSRRLYAETQLQLARARSFDANVDSALAAITTDPTVRARRDELAARVDSIRAAEAALRQQIAIEVGARGRAELAVEREAIDYHIADAAYERAIEVATDTLTAKEQAITAPPRIAAIAGIDTFLARYPRSIARGESRFRLADLRLLQARDDFQAHMASFLGETPSADDLHNRALAPFVDYAPAVALYRDILVEDLDFPHMDAVLFNLGMILSDDGQKNADVYLTRLVQQHAASPLCQEAWLRMGSDRFDRREFAECVPYFEHAIDGADVSVAAIALYKMGWAQFEQDHFGHSTDAFRCLMDLYLAHTDLARATDLRKEAEEYLVHSLSRAGGAEAFRGYFDSLGGREYESRVLLSLGHLMRSVSLYEDAIACDELWLSRYPLDPAALTVAEGLVDTYRRWNRLDAARDAKYAQAARFLPDAAWMRANRDTKAWSEADAFAQSAYRETAAHDHLTARANDKPETWKSAFAHYEAYLSHWPAATDAARMHFMAGEAANRLEGYAAALAHFTAAAGSDSTALALDATWQRVSVADTWYRTSSSDSLAVQLLSTGNNFVGKFPADARCADIVWRQGNVAYAHGWYRRAAASLALFGESYPTDARAARAVRMSGDALYRVDDFELAGATYEKALALATTARDDTAAVALTKAIPLCYYKHAESVAAADSIRGDGNAAPLFANVAARWPHYPHADLALYRAGLGYASRGSLADAAAAWETLLGAYPTSEYARDSAVQIALAHEQSGNAQSAASAYERFSRTYADDPDAPSALLKAADLLLAAGDEAGGTQMQDAFLDRFPGDVTTAMEIRSERAKKELAAVSAGTTSLGAATQLDAYLKLAAAHPELASPQILAEVDYRTSEALHASYAATGLTQPLPKSIGKKKGKLEELLKLYDRVAAHGVTEYARAAAYRTGAALIEFGDALMKSERPVDLDGEDLFAYNDVIEQQSWEFYDRGEKVWSDLLSQLGHDANDPGQWVAQTRAALWPRLSARFLYRPEVDYPLVSATPPPKARTD